MPTMASEINNNSSSSLTSPSDLSLHQNPPFHHHHHHHHHQQQSSLSISDRLTSLSIIADNGGGSGGDEREKSDDNRGQIKDENVILQDDDINSNNNDNEATPKGDEEERGKEWSSRRKGDNNGGGGGGARFPVRPEAENCSFYVRTGCCKFGMNCKFNHPFNLQRRAQGAKVNAKEVCVDSIAPNFKEKDESLDKEQIDCKYFDRPGGCKFGNACKFNHDRRINSTCELNFMGLPVRPGEKECPFYMRNGSCKYGANCKFNHPEPTSIGGPDALPGFNNGGSVFSPNASQSSYLAWSSSPTALKESPPYVPLIISPTQGVPAQPEWNSYQAPFFLPERSMKMAPTHAMNGQLAERPEQMVGDEFPERPGQPECSYFLKTGTCKYRSACKFHHPKSSVPQSDSCLLSDLGLPLRPGENVCSHYSRYGICKYGPACKYDHPIKYAHSSNLNVTTVDRTPVLVDSMVNNKAMVAGS